MLKLIKIIRTTFNDVHCYTHDNVNGEALASHNDWEKYLDALDYAQKFEEFIDDQYAKAN